MFGGDKRELMLFSPRHYSNWSEAKRDTLLRDGERCIQCGSRGGQRRLHVHHIDGSGRSDNENNSLDNLLTLCSRCHVRLHHEVDQRRIDLILQMRNEGLSYKKIGKRFGISGERVRQIVWREVLS